MYRTLLKKEFAEHAIIVCLLFIGFLVASGFALEYNKVAEYGVSPLQVVPVALVSLLPLIAILLGQRFIVRENMAKTRQFVEALPVSQFAVINVKFALGLVLNLCFALFLLTLAASRAAQVDSVDSAYFSLLLVKTLSISALTWSIVFCFSFCGFFRIVLYATLLVLILVLLSQPLFDATGFGPFALLQSGQFVFERDTWPWVNLFETWLLCAGFLLTGYTLAMIYEGSLVASLAKPAGRREYVATGLLFFAVLSVLGLLMENQQADSGHTPGEFELLNVDPAIAVNYRQADRKPSAERMLQKLSQALVEVQRRLAATELPVIQFEHDQQLTEFDIRSDSNNRVALRANFNDLDEYSEDSAVAAALHDVFQHLSASRATFEPQHWVLDGVSRWWAERGYAAASPSVNAEASVYSSNHTQLMARAVHALQALPPDWRISQHWQLIADRTGYSSATAIAWSAMVYLAERQGVDVVVGLARQLLTQPSPGWSLTTLQSKLNPFAKKFLNITGLQLSDFEAQWRQWMNQQATDSEVALYLSRIPQIKAKLQVDTRGNSTALRVYLNPTLAEAESINGDAADATEQAYSCRVQSERVSVFDHEMDWRLVNQQTLDCHGSARGVFLNAPYAPGDRVYVIVELLMPGFYEPLRLASGRFSVP